MQQADFARFRNVMAGLAELYQRELSNTLLDVYWLALGSWSLPEFESGAAHLMRTSKFMPRPADFTDLRKAAHPTAGEAWSQVLNHVRTGAYRWDSGPPTWDESMPKLDPAIERAVRALGGYRAIAMMTNEQLLWQEKRFCEHYTDAADAEEKREPLSLPDSVRKLVAK